MINQVLIEGYVADSYVYRNDLLVRLACYRDPSAPAKPATHLGENKEEPDFIYVRFINGHKDNLSFQPKTLLRVSGMITSRSYNETLEQFLEKAYKSNMPKDLSVEIVAGAPRQVMCGRNAVEVLVEKHEVLEKLNTGTLKAPGRIIFKVRELASTAHNQKTVGATMTVSPKTAKPSAISTPAGEAKPAQDNAQKTQPDKKKHKPTHRSQTKKTVQPAEKVVVKAE